MTGLHAPAAPARAAARAGPSDRPFVHASLADEARSLRVLDALSVGVFMVDAEGQPVYMNTAAERYLGRGLRRLDADQDLSAAYATYRAGTDALYPVEQLPLTRALRTRVPAHADDLEVRNPQETIPVEVWATPMFDEAGALTHAVAVFVDISERRKVERELAERTALVDLSGDAIYLRHPDGTILYWNHGAELKYGWSAAEATGKNAFELLHTELPMPREEIIQHLAAEGHWHGHAKQRTRIGEHIDVVVQWVAQKDRAGEINKVMVINTDVTDLRRAHDELARQASELTALNREYQRSNDDLMQFAYAASHDLAEPLRAIAGPISLLARRYQGQLDAEADTLIRFAVEGCDRMQKLISDLLTFSRVGRVDTVMGDVDMADIVKQLLSDLSSQINETGAKVEADPLPTVHGSAVELRQVLQNLVSNALKFHRCDHAPHVMITATRLTDAWRFSVSDDGIGIAPEYREQVFGMFKRLHSREDYAGTGIGLALVKKIVERHGGQVGVADGPGGVGSTFWFTIPDGLEVER